MQEGIEQGRGVAEQQELRTMFVFDFDGTLTKKAGQKTFDMFKGNKSPSNINDVRQLIEQGAFDNHMAQGAYQFLHAALKENSHCQVLIISNNYSFFIKSMLTHERFQGQGCLTGDEFDKIVVYDRNAFGNKADKLVEHLGNLNEEQKPHEIHIYDDSEREIEGYKRHQTLTKDYNQCHLHQAQPGKFNWTAELEQFFNPLPETSSTTSRFVSAFYCCGNSADDEEMLLEGDSQEDRPCCHIM